MNIILPIAYVALYGITMKIADLLDEHGLKWFKYSDIVFGFLCGIFGALLVLQTDPIISAVIFAMVVSCIIRNRLDFLNHRIAATLIIISAIFYGAIQPVVFIVFLIIFLIFGSIKDYTDDIHHSDKWWGKVSEMMLYYPIPTFIYCLLYGDWLLFWILAVYMISYDMTKKIAKSYGYK